MEPMRLAVFDIDGTLTKTNQIDDRCFVSAFAEELGITGINTDWSRYPSVSDSGITRHVFRERFGRLPSTDEVLRLQHRFVGLLEESYRQTPQLFAEVLGAARALRRLQSEPAWAVAIATGGWQMSARFKMQKARIDGEGIPAAFADDGVTREDIVKVAVARAQERYGQTCFRRVVYVGDGVWDVRAARRLNLAFLGVGSGERAAALRKEGATAIIHDFTDFARFLQTLEDVVYG
jgi:phosphoglycolate phosphatase-like HAD superfamily hydrolase